MRQTGTFVRYFPDKRFGFIRLDGTPAGVEDVFAHWSDVEDAFDDRIEGERVTLEVVDAPKGPRAVRVRRVAA